MRVDSVLHLQVYISRILLLFIGIFNMKAIPENKTKAVINGRSLDKKYISGTLRKKAIVSNFRV